MTNTRRGGPDAARVRTLVMVAVLSFFVQGAFLASALRRQDAPAWVTWVVVLCVAGAAITIALTKAVALARRGGAPRDEREGGER